MSRNHEYHVKIRERVIEEAMRLAREAWPAATDKVHLALAYRAVKAAALELDPIREFDAEEKRPVNLMSNCACGGCGPRAKGVCIR